MLFAVQTISASNGVEQFDRAQKTFPLVVGEIFEFQRFMALFY